MINSLLTTKVADSTDLGITEDHPIALSVMTHAIAGPTLRDMHWELELGVVMSGRMERVTREWVSPVDTGMIWLCGSWEPHGYRIIEAPCRVAVFVVNPLLLARLSSEACGGMRLYAPFAVPAKHRPQVPEPFRTPLLSLLAGLDTCHADRAWHSLVLQHYLIQATEQWTPPPVSGRKEGRFGRLMPALKMAFESRRHIDVAEAARGCGMSRNSFTDAFTSATGLTFADFALRRRLRGAAEALAHSEQPVKAIAFEWGFSDSSHLVRAFERHYSLTPGNYRIKSKTTGDA